MAVVSFRPGQPVATNSVLSKAQLIIEAFTADDESLSLTDLARRTGVAKASVHRLAQELLTWGILERAGTSYRLGLRLFEIGHRVPRQRIVRDAALPFLEDLLLATRETVHFSIRDGVEVLYLEKLVMHRGLSEHSRVAGRRPLHCTATGKVLLAHAPVEVLAQVLARGLRPLTRHTIRSPAVLRHQLGQVRERGVALEWEESRLGYASAAAPVLGGDATPIGALSVTAPMTRMNTGKVVGALRTAAAGIAHAARHGPAS